MVNSKIDAYIKRSEKWPEEMTNLRAILLRAPDLVLVEILDGKGFRDR